MSLRKWFTNRLGASLICIVAMLVTICSVQAGDNNSRPYDDLGRTNDDIPPVVLPPHASDQAIVKLATMDDATVNAVMSQYGTIVDNYLPRLGVYLVGITDGTAPEVLVSQMQNDSRIVSAQLNFLVDPMRPVQGSFAFPDENLDGNYLSQPAALLLNVQQAHQISTGEGVHVAVIDGGVNYEHPAFEGKAVSGYDYIDTDFFAVDEPGGDNSGHGTFVAGVIHLIAPNATIHAYRVCDPSGDGDGYVIAEAIMRAVDDGCTVINLSLVTASHHDAIATAIEYAKTRDVLVVAAAGNGTSDVPLYPASDPYVITVGAVDNNFQIADFSNIAEYVDVFAPGVDIYSPYLDAGYAWWSGTSFAAPFVTGQAALIMQKEENITTYFSREWIIGVIEQTVYTLDEAGTTNSTGVGGGIIDLLASLQSNPPVFGYLHNFYSVPDVIFTQYNSTGSLFYNYFLGTTDGATHSYTIQSVDSPEFLKSWTVDGPTLPTFVQFEVDPTGLALGTYQDTVLITIDGADNSPITKIFTIVVSDGEAPIEAYGVYTWTSPLIEGVETDWWYVFKPMARRWDADAGFYRGLQLPYQVTLEPDPEFISYVEIYENCEVGDGDQYYDNLTTDYWKYHTAVGDLTPGIYYDTIYISVEGAVNNPYMLEIRQEVRPDEWIELIPLEPYPSNMTVEGYDTHLRHFDITFHDVPVNCTDVDTLYLELKADGAPRNYTIEQGYSSNDPNPGFFDWNPTAGVTADTIRFVIDWSQHGCPYIIDEVIYKYNWDVKVDNVADINYILNINFNLVDTEASPLVESSEPVNAIDNYPNPFNPTTEIKFSLAQETDVKLGVFNILGQSVKVLVDDQMTAGTHSVVWDGKDEFGHQVASGIYFYKIVAGDFVASKQMILLK